jgi:glutamyl-tRNA reductase
MNEILLLGVNHKCAQVELRERFAFVPEQIHRAVTELQINPGEQEMIILSTCNRSELYVYAKDICRVENILMSYLGQKSQLPPEQLNKLLFRKIGEEAVHHLLRVASGLDSLVVGENEILGQVKHALEIAQTEKSCGAVLSSAFRFAIRAGKRVRTETEIGYTGRSVSTAVVDLAKQICGSLESHTALIIGAGKISALTGKALVNAGLHCVFVTNRTYDKALKLVDQLGKQRASAIHFENLEDCLVQADIVICSTGAPHFVLHADQIVRMMTRRPEKPLLVLDLAIPRDADPLIEEIPNVCLKDIDDLQDLAEQKYPLTAETFNHSESIVKAELAAFLAWYQAHLNAPLIRDLKAKADLILQSELEHTFRRMGDLTVEQQEAIALMGHSIVNKLLHDPLVSLRKTENSADKTPHELVQTVFGLH